ncbi:MAG: amidase [Deltaproteobacteria bacterium]|nr:amidase [Deltaproteobacteria bacterium]
MIRSQLTNGTFVVALAAVLAGFAAPASEAQTTKAAPPWKFRLEEARIEDIHRAIRTRQITCEKVVQAYINRIRAYDGQCVAPVNPNDANDSKNHFPDIAKYSGTPMQPGALQATISDPSKQQTYGYIRGVKNTGQLRSLNTVNVRSERSVTCKATCDLHPSKGPLPSTCSQSCEAFRAQPDGIERARELDRRFGANPNLTAMPLYCAPFSIKDIFDAKDMRSTGGADVNYAIDAAPMDSTIVAQLRAKGAIILAKANLSEYNGASGDPGGEAKAAAVVLGAGNSRSTWGGNPCNPYDTERAAAQAASSSGSGVSVAANLVACSICEETGGSCRVPAAYNGLANLNTGKAIIPFGGGIGADPFIDRAGIQCRTVKDTAIVLDALKDPQRGYYDPRDIYTALPKALISQRPYASFAGQKSLKGMRIGIVREFMVKHGANDAAISDQIDKEIKTILRDKLGAQLFESVDPLYGDDPTIANLKPSFQEVLAEILPFHMPEYLFKTLANGEAEFPLFASKINVSVGKTPGGGTLSPAEYMARAAEGLEPFPPNLNLRRITNFPRTSSFRFHLSQYLIRRGDDRVKDWPSLNANASYYSGDKLAAFINWQNLTDIRSAGLSERIRMREVMQRVVLKVMRENNLDVLVNPLTTIPIAKIGGPVEPEINSRPSNRFAFSADAGIPEMVVPAGFNRVVFEPKFALSSDTRSYQNVSGTERALLDAPGLPISLSFWAGPGEEATIIKAAAAYEAATKHRRPPAAFGPLPGEP